MDVSDFRRFASRLSHATQSGSHPHADRGLDLYETPPAAIKALLRVEPLPRLIWEPAAGRGAIANVLRDAGHIVITSDICRYDFELDFVADFLATTDMPAGCGAIVTNAPFKIITEFTRHAIDLALRIYLLCRLAFLEAECRTDILESRGLARVHVFRERLPMMHRHGWTGRRATSAIPFAWFVWLRDHTGPATISRFSWKEKQPPR